MRNFGETIGGWLEREFGAVHVATRVELVSIEAIPMGHSNVHVVRPSKPPETISVPTCWVEGE